MSMSSEFRVAVIGMGPVGSIISAHLVEAGADVVVCDINRRRIDAIKANGIILRNTIEKTIPVVRTSNTISELSEFDLDLIIISVKCSYLKSVLDEIRLIDSGKVFFMSAQNGIGTEQDIASHFSKERTLRMVINFAGNMIDMVEAVDVTFFNPPNYVSALSIEGREIEQNFIRLLKSVRLTTEPSDDIQIHIWQKAILNIALCAPCAILGKTMGEVMSFPPTLKLVESVLQESIAIAEAEGINLGPEFPDVAIGYLNKGGPHKPTMLVDVENKLLTEIDYLNGKIVEYGKKHGLATPLNYTLTAMVKFLESSYRG